MWDSLPDLVHGLDGDPAVRLIVVRGAGEKAFASGSDILIRRAPQHDRRCRCTTPPSIARSRRWPRRTSRPSPGSTATASAAGSRWPCIATCVWPASERSSAFRRARSDSATTTCGCNGLTWVVGPTNAKEILYTSRRYGPDDALRMGLVESALQRRRIRRAAAGDQRAGAAPPCWPPRRARSMRPSPPAPTRRPSRSLRSSVSFHEPRLRRRAHRLHRETRTGFQWRLAWRFVAPWRAGHECPHLQACGRALLGRRRCLALSLVPGDAGVSPLPRPRMGLPGHRRPPPVREALPRRLPGRPELAHDPQQARGVPARLRRVRRRKGRGAMPPTSAACWPTPASSAIAARSSRRSTTPGACSN